MVMERGQSGLRRMGDGDLAKQLAGIQQEFTRRHTEMEDISFEDKLPERSAGTPPKLHPILEGKVQQEIISIGGKTAQELLAELTQNGIRVMSGAKRIMESPDFITSPNPQQIELVRLHVGELGIGERFSRADEIYKRAQDLGLDPCPAEVGPQYCLQNKNQFIGQELYIGMKPIRDSHVMFHSSHVFFLEGSNDTLRLFDSLWRPGDGIPSQYEFIFSPRKSS